MDDMASLQMKILLTAYGACGKVQKQSENWFGCLKCLTD